MSAHSILAPSSMARTVQCPASVTMEQQFPETGDKPEAMEGEASHWGGFEMLQGRLVSIGDRAPNAVLLTQEMVEGADLYYDDVVTQLRPFGMTPADGAAESPVAITRIHPQCWGTPDFRVWIPAATRFAVSGVNRSLLKLWDYKFGHRAVEAYENWQGLSYVVGCHEATNLRDVDVDVEFTVVQPRSFHGKGPIQRWTFNLADVRALINIASTRCHEALAPNPKAMVGPECRDCRARHACPTLRHAAADACDVAGKAQPVLLSPEALGVELRMLKRAETLLKARIDGLEEQALRTIKQGRPVPFFAIGHSAGRRVWSKPTAEVLALGSIFQVNLAKPVEPVTPLQAVKAGIPEAMLATFSTQPMGGAQLVPDDGARARAIFGKVQP